MLWGLSMLVAYWWYEARDLRSFGEQTALFYGKQLRLPAPLLLHTPSHPIANT